MMLKSCPLLRAAPAPRAFFLTLFAAWTAWWVPRGWAHMKAESLVVQNGFGGDGVQLWEIFDLKMTVAYTVVRWLPGAVLLVGAWWWVGRRRAGTEAVEDGGSAERPLAA
jgi:hypothetical protein